MLKPIDHESMIAFCDEYSSIVGRRVLFSQKDFGKDGSIEFKPIYASVLLRGNILSVILLPRVFFFYIIKPLRNKCREIPVLPSFLGSITLNGKNHVLAYSLSWRLSFLEEPNS